MMASTTEAPDRAPAPLPNGTFVAVVGPSGAGKDTIIEFARAALGDQPGYHFVRRVVTRPSSVDTEDHDTLSQQQFLTAKRAGEFSHSWEAHGLCYGLPMSVDEAIERGSVAIANVSRGVLPALRQAYANFIVVQITASHEVLARRLAARGREDAAEIERRLMRAAPNPCDPADAILIDNSGEVTDAGNRFLAVLKSAVPVPLSEQS
ncbi:phosphonate metabolism protein/1,5-bisphosphokinase (PRPP-forming) PhnN [Phyllobacterium endophyticum]|uniref:Ribose 1,5-bisphosphate phosphokinase PhnN n=1 Tax=Phyllobacterium endophyticum TaxID=1149773 RepID=A0A2P7AU05_9HYPH|nr:phosphonate metabolism protein/1,5-bisphosphokinase (PRPP-forming) PhnN [Phyllobacterium endophyticum]MBB3234127.1 ribose 1,5-bisphosphokinase [Phyllobacterium endophyticum]PSH57695.1 phosphonate metabolism protein/1,5-bisphosphokinase (PRPP-forming) PhnN [Phyllobacterium endophyticum]TYR43888.1 phosphonate metabolism protein/1,5-bisphosphokinase (PRPP-forming) PhnN [Phyllobacterium endophyticum]